ncbi:MAG: hypothetical protein HC907_19875 [Richelia sp. SM1_7_0]|nr:hypothetical protein [Richelia sp. SM1_7_0]
MDKAHNKEFAEDTRMVYFASEDYAKGSLDFDYEKIKQSDDFDIKEFVNMLKFALTKEQSIEVLRNLVSKHIISLDEYKQILRQFRDFRRPRFSSSNLHLN